MQVAFPLNHQVLGKLTKLKSVNSPILQKQVSCSSVWHQLWILNLRFQNHGGTTLSFSYGCCDRIIMKIHLTLDIFNHCWENNIPLLHLTVMSTSSISAHYGSDSHKIMVSVNSILQCYLSFYLIFQYFNAWWWAELSWGHIANLVYKSL